MALDPNINTLEKQKFEEVSPGVPAVRVTGTNFSGTFVPTGLTVGGKITYVTLNNSTWTALPPTPLLDRNGLSVQNSSNTEIVLEYDNSIAGYKGVIVKPNGERFYDIKDTIIMYAKCQTGTCEITVEELA